MAHERLLLPFSGAKLWEVRERAGLSRPALARKCGEHGRKVTPQHLNRIETGKFKPSPGLLRTLVDALNAVVREHNPDASIELDDLLDAEAGAA